jgi:protein-L-isoaspartate(D-aspartate) O-methyltransferase
MTIATQDLIIEQVRRFYAEEIRAVTNIDSTDLVNAFASVPRENFLGPPPWHYCSGASLKRPTYRTTTEVRDLYHDVHVALKADQLLNNGQPGMAARLIAAMDLSLGMRVLHIGCGTGYYSAILATVIGSTGTLVAVEVDADLAVRAAANLAGYENVEVVNCDGSLLDLGKSDAILVNAGVTHPHPLWLQSLTSDGVLVLPLCVGRSAEANNVMVIRIVRHGDKFSADLLQLMTLYLSPSQRDPVIRGLLNESLESRSLVRLKSIRIEEHSQSESCIVHTPGFCLSAEAV